MSNSAPPKNFAMPVYALGSALPRLAEGAWVALGAQVVGDVRLGKDRHKPPNLNPNLGSRRSLGFRVYGSGF